MKENIISRLQKHIQWNLDRNTEAHKRDGFLIQDAVDRLIELEQKVSELQKDSERLDWILNKSATRFFENNGRPVTEVSVGEKSKNRDRFIEIIDQSLETEKQWRQSNETPKNPD